MWTVNEFREMIDQHIDAGTCYVCKKPALAEQGLHGALGAHWSCVKKEEEAYEQAVEKIDSSLKEMGVKKPRAREGQGKTAQKAKDMAVKAIGTFIDPGSIFDVTIWNQQGVYRGPRWDLDAWGIHFKFWWGGREFSGQASSIATMTACVKAGGIKASRSLSGGAFTFDLYPLGS